MAGPAEPLSRGSLLRYGALGLPLAFAGLPVYVHVPKFYADALHVNLALMGTLLFVLRLLDVIIDPIIGIISDRLHRHTRHIMAACVPVLIAGYIALFNPPAWAENHALAWLAGCLALVYASFSTLMINYYAMGIEMAEDYHGRTRVAAFREASMLIGVLLASMLPALMLQSFGLREAYSLFSLLLAPLLLCCAWVCLSATTIATAPDRTGNAPSFLSLLAGSDVRWVLTIAFFNAMPTAITSMLFLFYTSDVLKMSETYSGLLLAVYFLSAGAGMPLWSRLSARLGKKTTLMAAMGLAIVCFVWAWLLQAGDSIPFAIICILSGFALGGDSMLFPSLLADVLEDRRQDKATGFGLWTLNSKLALALAAGVALPLLSMSGYQPGISNSPEALAGLSLSYALLPCLFKALAVCLLYFSPLDRRIYAS